MQTCKLCQREPARPNGLCPACMVEIGVIEMPPARRRPAPCTKCNATRFVRVIPREYTVSKGGDWNTPEIAPMTLTQLPNSRTKVFGKGNVIDAPSVGNGKGTLETYTCLGCGHVEWYCQDPTEIPIGPEFMSELVDVGADKPYR